MGEDIAVMLGAFVGLLVGLGSFTHFIYITLNWVKTDGTVIDNVGERAKSATVSNEAFSAAYFAKIEYQDQNGHVYISKGDIGKTKPWPIGHKIAVLYNPKKPQHIMTMNIVQRFGFSLIFIVMGSICLYLVLNQ